jgi:methionyl-tRNA formyltransferase
MNKINVVFMAEKKLGLKCLKLIHSIPYVNLVAICTRKKTKEIWWKKQYVREFAEINKIPILKRSELSSLKQIDVIFSVLYPFIIEDKIIKLAKNCAVNLHQAPLPEYRGCNSVSHAIINGESEFGCTLHLIDKELDKGDIIEKKIFKIKKDITALELYKKTDNVCYKVFKRNVEKILLNDFKHFKPKNKSKSYLYERDSLKNKKVELNWDFDKTYNFCRGNEFPPFEPAYFEKDGKKIYLITNLKNFKK